MEVLIHNRSHERKVTDMIVEWFEELVYWSIGRLLFSDHLKHIAADMNISSNDLKIELVD